MELPGANYLYALATVSVTFVGFSALLLVFRETIGGRMTGYDSYFALSFMQAGFIVAAGGLLPQLLAFYEMSHTSVWRASSLIMAIPIFLFVAKTPGRRRAATKAHRVLRWVPASSSIPCWSLSGAQRRRLAHAISACSVCHGADRVAVHNRHRLSDGARARTPGRPWSNIAPRNVITDPGRAKRATETGYFSVAVHKKSIQSSLPARHLLYLVRLRLTKPVPRPIRRPF